MFLQSLLARISQVFKDFLTSLSTIKDFEFSRENVEFFISNNFRELILLSIIIPIFLAIIIFSISRLAGGGNRGDSRIITEESAITAKPVIHQRKFQDVDFLINNSFIYPNLAGFEISNQYIDFMALKKLNSPDLSIIMEEFDSLVDRSLDDACLFNFEKRSGTLH